MKKTFITTFFIGIVAFVFYGCENEFFPSTGIAEDHFFLKSGNQHMPVLVAGNVSSNKLIVIIHGGPGGNSNAYRDDYVRNEVENEFALVYWDQRFAGNTQGNGGNTDISAFRKDIKNLLILLRHRYGKDKKFYLFGHSWGGFLAPYFLVDGDNQDMVKGWIQIGGAHNYPMNDSLTREMLLHYGNLELAAGRNAKDWEEIVNWCNANGFEGRDNGLKLNGFAHDAEKLIDDVGKNEREPLDLNQMKQNSILTQALNSSISGLREIDAPTYSTPNSDQLHKIQIPTLLLWGKYDFVCPPGLADDIEANIGTSDVTKFIYKNSGHSPMLNQRVQFWDDVIEWVRRH
jgi:pimeloyl-ACP methyl ester carboxylesterase